MNDVIVAAIGAVGLVLVALITVFGAKINGRLRSVQGQVENDHSTNLRVEQDERHDETRRWFWALWRRQDAQDARIDEVLSLVRSNVERIDDIEDTVNPKERSP